MVTTWSPPLLTWEDTASLNRRSCPTLIPPFAKSFSGFTSLLLISQVPFINPSSTQVYEILRHSHSFPWGPGVCPFSDGHAWLRNCRGGTHVSCTLRPYSRRSCCQDRRRSILRNRLTKAVTAELETSTLDPLQMQPQTLRFKNCHQPQLYCDLGLGLGLWHPPGLSASNCSLSVLQQARNGWIFQCQTPWSPSHVAPLRDRGLIHRSCNKTL